MGSIDRETDEHGEVESPASKTFDHGGRCTMSWRPGCTEPTSKAQWEDSSHKEGCTGEWMDYTFVNGFYCMKCVLPANLRKVMIRKIPKPSLKELCVNE